jgi:hypothetical protein
MTLLVDDDDVYINKSQQGAAAKSVIYMHLHQKSNRHENKNLKIIKIEKYPYFFPL